eukprot:scaffold2961_cov62-Phaeocystis_antarctica.AAC.1
MGCPPRGRATHCVDPPAQLARTTHFHNPMRSILYVPVDMLVAISLQNSYHIRCRLGRTSSEPSSSLRRRASSRPCRPMYSSRAMSSSRSRRRASSLTTGSAPGAMAGAVPFSLGITPDGTAGSQAPRLIDAAVRLAAACPSGDRATHNAASSAVAKLPRRALAGRDWRSSRRSSPSCSWPRAASAPPPVPAAAPPRSSALQSASPLPPALRPATRVPPKWEVDPLASSK